MMTTENAESRVLETSPAPLGEQDEWEEAALPVACAGEGSPASGQTYAQIPATLPCSRECRHWVKAWLPQGSPEQGWQGLGVK